MRVPHTEVEDHSGTRQRLSDLVVDGGKLLVFVRHLGCPMCKAQVAELRDLDPRSIIFVAMASKAEAEEFKTKLQSPHRFIADQARELYRHFKLIRANPSQMFSPKVIVKMAGAAARGYAPSRSSGDPLQLGGAFLVAPEGDVKWSRRFASMADILRRSEAERLLQEEGGVSGKD